VCGLPERTGLRALGEEAGGKVPRRYGPIRPSSIPVLRAEIGQHLFDRMPLPHRLVEIVDRILLDGYSEGGIEHHCRAPSFACEAGAFAVSQLVPRLWQGAPMGYGIGHYAG
jgi:hypothetical protein